MASNQPIEDVYIAVVGVSGAGKDSLISSITAHDEACAIPGQDASFLYDDRRRVHLLDMPVLAPADDEPAEQQQALTLINNLVADGKSLDGIILLHPITDEHSAGEALRNMDLLRSVSTLDSQTQTLTVLATSMWSGVAPELGAERERALVEDESVGRLLNQQGGKLFRYEDTRESAMDILSHVVSKHVVNTRRIESGVDRACQTGDELVGEWDKEIARARDRHMARLAEMYGAIEQATREHENNVRDIVKVEVESLQKKIRDGEEERGRLIEALDDMTRRRDGEVKALQEEINQERTRHAEETEQLARAAQEELTRREEEVRTEITQESEARIKGLLEELSHEADERLNALRAEMTHEADGQVQEMRREMEKMKLGFDSEREQHMKSMKAMRAEMSRLVEREKEARERAQRVEAVRKTEEHRQPLQAWAVARLWGVGQTRSR